MHSWKHIVAVGLIMLFSSLTWSQQTAGGPGALSPAFAGLKIVVLEGEDGVNIIKKKTAVKSVVEVRDKNDLPVAGALVVFLLPRGGPSAAFVNGRREVSLGTGGDGRAEAAAVRPSGKGSFRIQVRATFQGQSVTTSIQQTNFLTAAAARAAGKVPGSSAGTAGSQGAASSASAGGSGAAGAASSAAVGTATSGGLSGLAVAGIAAGGAAAIGGGLVASGVIGKSSTPDCTSLANQVYSDLNSEINICSSASSSFNQCKSAAQTVLNDAGKVCSCAGTNSIPAELQSLAQELEQLAHQLGLTLPSSCGF